MEEWMTLVGIVSGGLIGALLARYDIRRARKKKAEPEVDLSKIRAQAFLSGYKLGMRHERSRVGGHEDNND